jgi:fengycin family lipopeptide synthetase B
MNKSGERISRLSEKQRKLLAVRLKRADVKNPHISDIRKREEDQRPIPLSFAQQQMWLLDQLSPGTTVYTIPAGLHLLGELHLSALEHTFAEIILRHEALRTLFVMEDEYPVQSVQLPYKLPMIPQDLSMLDQRERDATLSRLIQEELARPFDLTTGPLIRSRLFLLAPDEHFLLLNVHHIVFDGWSAGLLTQEFVQLYAAFSQGNSSPLPPLSLQYADFAHWQREWSQGPQMQEQLAFWQQRLSAPLSVLELPLDRPRPPRQTFAGAHHPVQFSPELTRQWTTLGQAEGATLFMTVLAAFEALLFRYSGQSDLLIGTPIANRNRAETENLIGCFVNTLVLRTDLSGEPTFRDLLKRVRQVALKAYEHQDMPFEELVKLVHLDRESSRNPLFQVMFVFQNASQSPRQLKDLTVKMVQMSPAVAKFDLTLVVWETPEGLQGQFEYNTALFDAATIARWADHFQVLVEGLVAHPDQQLTSLPLVTAAEKQLIREFSVTNEVVVPDKCLHQLFETQVERHPEAIAVVCEAAQLTYRALNAWANQVATALQARGVGVETRVGVCLDRSFELVVGLLGVLKAGGTYVPLDPSYPRERLNFILEDSQASVVLSHRRCNTALRVPALSMIWLDDLPDLEESTREAQQAPERPPVSPANAAYIIYTSGSTGRPKGVVNTHQNVVSLFAATEGLYQFNEQDVWTLFHSFAFDFSVWEFWGALLYGGRLVVVPYLLSRSPEEFYRLLQEQQVTVLNQTPSSFSQLLQAEARLVESTVPSLRLVIFGGEALNMGQLAPWFERHGDEHPQLINMYGITETTVHVSLYPLNCADLDGRNKSLIGRPIPGWQTYLLDQHLQVVPLGVPGELYVGGKGVARGYLGQPELTAERFLPHPFSQEPGARLYKTGDRARYLIDGTLEYLGRTDQQVKVRGFRIELGEVEALLEHMETVRQAVVLLREDQPGNPQLVAYVVPTQPGVEPAQLKHALRQRVPHYLVPTLIILLDALPLLSSGKVDRRRLPVPLQDRSQVVSRYLPPRTPLEKQLVLIWEQVLERQEIGVQDNFFELGGHSLKAIQLLARLREKLQKNVSLGHFFQTQTIAEMAILLERNSEPASACLLTVRKAESACSPLFLFHPAGGEIFVYRMLVDQLMPDIPVYGLQSRALMETASEHTSIEAMADEYVSAIRQQQPAGPYALLGWSMGGVLAVAVAANLEGRGQEVQFIGLLDSYLTADQSQSTDRADPLIDLSLTFGGKLIQAFANLSHMEQEQLREELLDLSERERCQQVLSWGKERKLFPDDLSIETFLLQATLVRTHRTLLNRYQAPTVQAPLVIWWASEHTQARTDWSKYTRNGVHEITTEANHFTIIQPPHVQIVVQDLENFLKSAQSEDSVVHA